jgi:hypothetical protein
MAHTLTREEANALAALPDSVLVRCVTTANMRHSEQHLERGAEVWARPAFALAESGSGRLRVLWSGPAVPETRPDPSYRPPGPQRPDMWLDAELP